MTGDIIDGSSMIGILIIIYSLTDDSGVYYNFAPREAEQLRVIAIAMGLPDYQYEVSVFVIDESGLPFPKAAASPRAVQINGIMYWIRVFIMLIVVV